ncbi:hypothetical protein PEC18_19555 [Paucibacter sp. O1-1]|nr:hypothetical protein [Paucibacter sp. O1-1]MDA3827978.1 hypothetical protein [Paucibacter sp. O1-1]
MAAKTVQLDIVSAEDSIYHGEVSFFEVNGAEGEFGIMPNHVALLTKIKPGMARFIKQDGSEEVLYLSEVVYWRSTLLQYQCLLMYGITCR